MSERSEAWTDYLTVAHRLDDVRRDAATSAAAEAEAVANARAEIPVVQARLGLQAGRLLEAALEHGVPPPPLIPGPAEQHLAENTVAGGPAVVLAALRQARSTVDVADAALLRINEKQTPPVLRNLAVYGPAGLVATIVTAAVDDRARTFYAITCGLVTAALLFGVAWLLLGVIYPRQPKTPEVGALVCTAPVVLVSLLFLIT